MLYHLQHVTRSYGSRTVLSVDELAIPEGETLALIGPSGAGKSTLLRLLGLLEQPSRGTLSYAGRPVTGPVPLHVQREVTLLFQRPLLLDRSVRRNVAYGLRLRGLPAGDKVEAMLDQLGLTHVGDARALTLSGGEMQRVALARALVVQPRVLLLDEPTANLDPANVARIEQTIQAFQQAHGATIVLATHNIHQAGRLTRRTAMLLDGRLIEIGPTKHMLTAATDPRTQAFVTGTMVY